MLNPERRRDPRSGKKRTGAHRPLPITGCNSRKAERLRCTFRSYSDVFSESDLSSYNKGDVSLSGSCKDDTEERVDVMQDSLPLADSNEVCLI